MQTQCSNSNLEFEGLEGRKVVAAFDGGAITSNAGAVLLRHTDRAIGLFDRLAACFNDRRDPDCTVHGIPTLVAQRVVGIALGYEDIDDHDTLRHDPMLQGLLVQEGFKVGRLHVATLMKRMGISHQQDIHVECHQPKAEGVNVD